MATRFIVLSKTIITYFCWLLLSVIFFSITIPLALLPTHSRYDSRVYFFLTRWWGELWVRCAFINVVVQGRENIPSYPEQPSIVLVNHASALDIPLIEMYLKSYPHVWLSNDYSKVPFFGILLKRMHVIVNKLSSEKLMSSLRRIYTLMCGKKRHLVIFPEGTRYDDGKIHDFYEGFAILAKKLKRPVIPVVLCGMHKIYPKGSYVINAASTKIKMSIGKPIYVTKDMSREEFVRSVHSWFTEEMRRLKNM